MFDDFSNVAFDSVDEKGRGWGGGRKPNVKPSSPGQQLHIF